MKLLSSFLFLVLLLLGSSGPAAAQDRPPAQPDNEGQKGSTSTARDYAALIREIFAPVTDELNLTREQEFQIIAIITGTEVKCDPLIQRLNEVEEHLVAATFVDSRDDETINQLSEQEASLLSQIIAMKSRAKASIYQLLTPTQRTLVTHQFRGKLPLDATLGAIGVY
jgi:hypothetical protein